MTESATLRKPPRRINFTKADIDRLPAPTSGRTYTYDERTPGLAVCVTDTGAKTFYLYRRISNRPERIRIGSYPAFTIDQARRRAAELNGEIARGGDPTATRRAMRAETTFGELWVHYLDVHAKPHKRTWDEDQRQYESYLAHWGNRVLSAIDQPAVSALHAKIGRDHGPYQANRVLAMVSSMFTHAQRFGFSGNNPAKGCKRFKEKRRERFLSAEELGRFFAALNSETNLTIRDYVIISLLTGARRGNVQAMRWDDIDLERGLWKILGEEAKGGEPLLTVLPAKAVEVLAKRRELYADSAFVFPSHGATGHLTEPKKAWAALLNRAKIDDLRLHDLRRTLGSWLAMGGAGLPLIGKALGHKSQQATAVYARLAIDPVKDAVESASVAMLTAAGEITAAKPKKKSTSKGRKPRRKAA